MALNHFSDLAVAEFLKLTSGTTPPMELDPPKPNLFSLPTKTAPTIHTEARLSKLDVECQLRSDKTPKIDLKLPAKFDWRQSNVVSSVKNQGDCGGCYAFSTVAVLESAKAIKLKNEKKAVDISKVDFSEQRLINCAKAYANISGSGCRGGQSVFAFNYLKEIGATPEAKEPYTGNGEDPCRDDKAAAAAAADKEKIADFCVRSKYRYGRPVEAVESLSDVQIQDALVSNGPLYALIRTEREFQLYSSGILEIQNCSTVINHAVTLVGYDEQSWIVRNSWSERWGEGGYFRVVRGKNMCGINSEIAWPLL